MVLIQMVLIHMVIIHGPTRVLRTKCSIGGPCVVVMSGDSSTKKEYEIADSLILRQGAETTCAPSHFSATAGWYVTASCWRSHLNQHQPRLQTYRHWQQKKIYILASVPGWHIVKQQKQPTIWCHIFPLIHWRRPIGNTCHTNILFSCEPWLHRPAHVVFTYKHACYCKISEWQDAECLREQSMADI